MYFLKFLEFCDVFDCQIEMMNWVTKIEHGQNLLDHKLSGLLSVSSAIRAYGHKSIWANLIYNLYMELKQCHKFRKLKMLTNPK